MIPVVSLCNEEEEGIVQLPDNNEITAPTFKLLPPISKSRKYQCDTEMEPNGIIADPTSNMLFFNVFQSYLMSFSHNFNETNIIR